MIYVLKKSMLSVDLSKVVAIQTWVYTISHCTPRGIKIVFEDGKSANGIELEYASDIDEEFKEITEAWQKYKSMITLNGKYYDS